MLKSIAVWLYRLAWKPGDPVSPGEVILGQKVAQLTAELRTVTLEKRAAEDEVRVMQTNVDMLTEIVERERARVRAESEYYANWLALEKRR